MASLTIPARNDLTLDQFVDLLVTNTSVSGILFMGSTATGSLKPWSDFDLLVVFDELPGRTRFVTTWVEGHLTEIYGTTVRAILRIVAGPAFPIASEEGVVVRWLWTGRIAFDRTGLLASAREAAATIELNPMPHADAYGTWRTVSYNVTQLERIARSDAATTGLVVDMRLLYSLGDVMVAYFTARGLLWQGEKAAISYWESHDPAFLEQFRAALSEPNRSRKIERYRDVAQLTVAPIGPLWPTGATMFGLGPAFGSGDEADESEPPDDLDAAAASWRALFETDQTGR